MSDQNGTFAHRATDASRVEYIAKLTAGEMFKQIVPIVNVLIIALGFFSLSIEVFFRRSFGERYITVIRLVLAAVAVYFVSFSTSAAVIISSTYTNNAGGYSEGGYVISQFILNILYWGFILAGGYHLWVIFQRNQRGERWYSHSFGISRFAPLIGRKVGPFTIDDWALYRFVEPGVILALAFVTSLTHRFLGVLGPYLYIAGFTMFVKNNYLYIQERGLILDMLDSQIINQYFDAASEGAPKTQTEGLSVVRAPRAIDRNNNGVPDPIEQPTAGAIAAAPLNFDDDVRVMTGQVPSAPASSAADEVPFTNPFEDDTPDT